MIFSARQYMLRLGSSRTNFQFSTYLLASSKSIVVIYFIISLLQVCIPAAELVYWKKLAGVTNNSLISLKK